jgi:putative DNA primase/helicase
MSGDRVEILEEMTEMGWKPYLVCSSFEPKMKDGKMEKGFVHCYNWRDEKKRILRYDEEATGFALVCGKDSGVSVIDIDEPELVHNEEIIAICNEESNCYVKTRKGFHYYFKYNPILKQTQGDIGHGLDIRNDGGIIYCPPGEYRHPETKEIYSYDWIMRPKYLEEKELRECPESVIEILRRLGGRRYINEPEPEVLNSVVMMEDDLEEETNDPEDDEDEMKGTNTDEAILIRLLNATHKKRFDHYGDWIKIMFICYNERIPLSALIEASKKSKFWKPSSPGWIAEQFKTIKSKKNKPITQASLWAWLRDDDYMTFKELQGSRNDFLKIVPMLNHNDCAKFFNGMYPDAYVNGDDGWYSLDTKTNIWKHTDGIPSGLFNHIADTFLRLVCDEMEGLSRKISKYDAKTLEEKEPDRKEKMKLLISTRIKLGSKDFTNGIIAFVRNLYYDCAIEEKMNNNRHLFAFQDGVCVDLTTGIKRNIEPEDYISLTCGYDYPKSKNVEVRAKINQTLWGLFENDEMPKYLLRSIANSLYGENRRELFYIMVGHGRNGKGLISDLISNVMGGYRGVAGGELLTNISKAQDAPSPVLVNERFKRVLMVSEPEDGKKLNVDLLKLMTGRDPITARGLYSKKMITCVPHYTPFISTNTLPSFNGTTAGIDLRVKTICFPLQFVDTPMLPMERQGDYRLKTLAKTEAWRDEFIQMLLEVNMEIKDLPCIPVPDWVRRANEEYMADMNPVGSWLRRRFTLGGDEIFTAADLYGMYREESEEGMSQQGFGRAITREMGRMGISRRRNNRGYYYSGLTLRPVGE